MDCQISPITGALEGKVPYTRILTEFKIPLAAIGLVHRRGARKYAAYSWLRDPSASNSTVWENIDAMLRHMTAHSIGLVRDPEGLPHIYHMCCRAGMLVSTYLREQVPDPFRWPEKALEDNQDHLDPGCWLTPEELVALANYYKYPTSLEKYRIDGKWDISFLQNHIYSMLSTAALTYLKHQWTKKKQSLFSELSLPENIFVSTMIYAKEFLRQYSYKDLVDETLLTEDDKNYCELFMK